VNGEKKGKQVLPLKGEDPPTNKEKGKVVKTQRKSSTNKKRKKEKELPFDISSTPSEKTGQRKRTPRSRVHLCMCVGKIT
jgi:hypothetical protein